MKKMRTLVIAAAVALTLAIALPGMAIAADQQGNESRGQAQEKNTGVGLKACVSVHGAHFVDLDGDGICDYYEDRSRGCTGYVDSDGDGVCDTYGSGGRGAGYVDSDGDGVCDNFEYGSAAHNQGTNTGNRGGNSMGNGAGNGWGCGNCYRQ